MNDDFFFESDDDDFFGGTRGGAPQQVASTRVAPQGGQGPAIPPPPPGQIDMANGSVQIQGGMDGGVAVGVAPMDSMQGAQGNPEEKDMMQKAADALGIKQTELKPPTIPEGDTLKESVCASFKRDCSGIGKRSLAVILPCLFIRKNLMTESDIFGPLIIMLVMGIFTSIGFSNNTNYTEPTGLEDDPSTYYVGTILIVLVGSLLCGINMTVLGGSIGVSQAFTLLGYSMLPMAVASIVMAFIPNLIAVIIVEVVTGVWGVVVSIFFMNKNIRGKKKPLAVYPIALIFAGLVSFETWVFGGLATVTPTPDPPTPPPPPPTPTPEGLRMGKHFISHVLNKTQ